MHSERQSLSHLRREWFAIALFAVFLTAFGFVLLWTAWEQLLALRWLVVALALLAYPFLSLWKRLPENRPPAEVALPLFPTLGLANRITITRGVLSAWVAGFLLNPRPEGPLAWVPGLLFLVAVLTDILDGRAARAAGQLTSLGAHLDMQLDSLGVLFASLLLVRYGQVPPIYALVGLARYLYLIGLWLHERLGGQAGDLPPSRFRRMMGGMQMGFIGVALLPVFSPPATQIAAILFMTPVLAGFVRDFLAVTGIYPRQFTWNAAQAKPAGSSRNPRRDL